ncbi:MAG: phosphoribosylanthranilate isomerase [Armatimonadota bacterium]
MTRVKICGITQVGDAESAVAAGADALGFVFAESPRQISCEAAREIIRELPPYIQTVGVFVGDDPDAERIADHCGLGVLQLHSGYTTAYVDSVRHRRLVLGVRVRDESSLDGIPGLQRASALLLDAFHPEIAGGTGTVFDWRLAELAKRLGKPLILSGGLTISNVQMAVKQVKPYAVDVSSGVETAPGKKDVEKVRQFIERTRSTNDD